MEIKWSRNFEKGLMRLDKKFQKKVREKLKLFIQDKNHPSLRYKKIQALKNETPPVYEMSVNMGVIKA